MRISARNVIKGTVERIQHGAVNSEVVIGSGVAAHDPGCGAGRPRAPAGRASAQQRRALPVVHPAVDHAEGEQ
jgi:hypothetical protein